MRQQRAWGVTAARAGGYSAFYVFCGRVSGQRKWTRRTGDQPGKSLHPFRERQRAAFKTAIRPRSARMIGYKGLLQVRVVIKAFYIFSGSVAHTTTTLSDRR